MTTHPPATHRAGTLAVLGGVLWALLPAGVALIDLEHLPDGLLPRIAVLATAWVLGVVPPAVMAAALWLLRAALRALTGRSGAVSATVCAAGLAAMCVGNGIEIGSITAGGSEVPVGNATFLLGFLVAGLAAIPLGIVLARRASDTGARVAGAALALALPLSIGIQALSAALAPSTDSGYWIAVGVPIGVAFLLLGSSSVGGRTRRAPTGPVHA